MTTKTMLGLVVLAIGLSTIPAFAEIDTPYQQFGNGTPINEIQCRDGKILMESPRNTPACVNESSVEILENKGFILVDVVSVVKLETTPADSIIPTNDNPIISKEKPIIQQLLNPVITKDIIPQDVTFDYILQMPPDDPDIFAQKMVGLFNDTITKTNHNDMNYMYITERGWIEIMKHPNFFGYEATDFKYTFFGSGRINPSHAEPIKTMLLEELGIVLDGTEYHREGSSDYTFKIIQTKDDLLVKSNTFITIFEPGYTFIKFSNWNDNLSDMNLYDLDKSIQNGREYALTFETLTKDECDISVRDNMDGATLYILHGRPVYDVYAGTCQVEYMDGHTKWFSVFVDGLTGDPLFIKNRQTF